MESEWRKWPHNWEIRETELHDDIFPHRKVWMTEFRRPKGFKFIQGLNMAVFVSDRRFDENPRIIIMEEFMSHNDPLTWRAVAIEMRRKYGGTTHERGADGGVRCAGDEAQDAAV